VIAFAAFGLAVLAAGAAVAAVRKSSPPPHRSRHRANPYLALGAPADTIRIPIPRSTQ
jgi:hypothetical protein